MTHSSRQPNFALPLAVAWLLPTMAGAAAIAWRIAGREAALIALLLAAPYHRLSGGIIAADQIFSSPGDEAREILARNRVTYVMACTSRRSRERGEAQAAAGLAEQLRIGAIPDWLEAVPVTKAQAISVYRFKS